MKPLKAGFTLSATVVLFYAVCTVLWLTFPEPFMNFMNALFQGLDFRKLQTSNSLSAWTMIYPGIIFALWFFAAGAFFAWLYDAAGGKE
ncbi:DUF5676 family membrane protein [Cupriavidus sp. CP313]